MTNQEPSVPRVLQAVEAETAEMRATKDLVRVAGARRAAKAQAEAPLAPMIPMTDDPTAIAATVSAEEQYQAMIAAQPAIDEAKRVKLSTAYDVFVKCRQTHAPNHPPHGIYLTEYPSGGSIAWDKWKARYKKADERYFPLDVLCQVCTLEGRSMPLDAVTKTSPEGDITINQRFLWRRPRDPKRLALEGETRVFDLGMDTQNIGRRKAIQKAIDGGCEVLE